MKLLEALDDFIKDEDLVGVQFVQTLKRRLAVRGEYDLLNEVEKVQKELGILDGQRMDTLLLAIAEELE